MVKPRKKFKFASSPSPSSETSSIGRKSLPDIDIAKERSANLAELTKLCKMSKKYNDEIDVIKKKINDYYNQLVTKAEESSGVVPDEDERMYVGLLKSLKLMNQASLEVNMKIKNITAASIDKDNTKVTSPVKTTKAMMLQLETSGDELPLWVPGYKGEQPPALCGSNEAPADYMLHVKDQVAALIDNRGDDANDNAIDDNCILAIVKDYNKHTNLYRVVDADPESKQTLHTLTHKELTPLPEFAVSGRLHYNCIFPIGSKILALYPKTTCFYQAVVVNTPTLPDLLYKVRFEDDGYHLFGYAPPITVSQRYVIASRGRKSSDRDSYPRWFLSLAGRLDDGECYREEPVNSIQSERCIRHEKLKLHESFNMILELGDKTTEVGDKGNAVTDKNSNVSTNDKKVTR